MMDDKTKQLIKDSFALIAPDADEFSVLFYNKLFELAPGTRYMFAEDMAEQRRKLMDTLAVVVKSIDNLAPIIPVVEKLGKLHGNIGVLEMHYEPVGEALIWAIGNQLDFRLTDEIRDAWVEIYTLLSAIMIRAALENEMV